MIGYIYLITDTTNGKQYVGQHHYHIENLDPNYHGSGHIIKMIYKKRPQTLKEEYLKTCYTQTELDEWEKYFIFLYNTLYPNGYNLRDGGNGGNLSDETRRKISEAISGEKHHMFGKKYSEEHNKKLSESLKGRPSPNKGKPMSEEQKKKISDANKGKLVGEKHHMFGKPRSEETKKKISESRKGKYCGENSKNFGKPCSEETKKKISDANTNGKTSKKVLQFTLDGEFVREWPSTMECERNGFFNTNVSACCRGKYKQAYGFIWKYKD